MSAADWLRAWDSEGWHRTGTDGDEAGAAWLTREAEALGATVSSEPFTFDRVDPIMGCVEVHGARIEGVPVFDAPSTGADGVTGIVGEDIGVVELSPQAVYSGEYRALRQDSSHRALVVVCRGVNPGLGLLNAEQFRTPYGAPAIHVAETVPAGRTARVITHYRQIPAEARNVVVTVAGTHRDTPPLVVMTPRSSWWQSTAERGGGLVCWLVALSRLVGRRPSTDVIFTANSGHELGHIGLDDFVARREGCERQATWVHWGANLGAMDGRLTVMSASDDLRDVAVAELTRAGRSPDAIAPKTQVPSGETRDIHRAGGRYLTLVGSNPLFHLPQDRWPHAVDVATVECIASAAARIVERLAFF